MTRSEKRELLRNYRSYKEQYQEIRYTLENVHGVDTSADRTGGQRTDTISRYNRLLAKLDDLDNKMVNIETAIAEMDNPLYSNILHLYYIDGLKLYEVADRLHYSFDHISHIVANCIDTLELDV